MSNQAATHALAKKLGHVLLRQNLRCTAAESCTGGGLAAAITDIPGSSQWFDRGFVTYSNASKQQMLAVPKQILASHGAVSEAVVRAMAEGALLASEADISVAISGIAGPDGGCLEKPVGTVWLAFACRTCQTRAHCYSFVGDRASIREQAVKVAMDGLMACADPMMASCGDSPRWPHPK
ncbi:MAG TPA: damage-inducible protein CinA [Legionella sp.]|nr:damage-inducible protein CinA [Legionella sp.]